jgi:NAD(P)-dependent dehydrogenase (short-subunit alcohol dehydrogenase family)
MKTSDGTSIRRREADLSKLWLAAAAGVALFGLRKALATAPDFDRQVVFITGGSRGLGLAMAEEFRRHGAHLVLLARDQKELDAARRQLQAQVVTPHEILLLTTDVASADEMRYAVEAAIAQFGRIDVLVNNAGVIQMGPLDAQTLADFHEAMDINFWGVVNATWAALPHMQKRPGSRIVNITSIGGRVPVPHLLPYTSSKFAALGFSLGLRTELAQKGISVTTIVPGLMRTGSHRNAFFKGDAPKEYSWFSLGASLPGIAISAKRAARAIVDAAWRRRAHVILGVNAKIASQVTSLFPGLSAEALSLANRMLPVSSDKQKQLGHESRTAVSESFATKLGRRAAARYNQIPTT